MATVTNHAPAAAHRSVEDVLGIEEAFPEILRMTQELFGGPASVMIETDPELPDVRYAVFETTAHGDAAELVQLRLEWHRRAEAVIGEAQSHKVCLSLDFDE
jgi:hypothetical protein